MVPITVTSIQKVEFRSCLTYFLLLLSAFSSSHAQCLGGWFADWFGYLAEAVDLTVDITDFML